MGFSNSLYRSILLLRLMCLEVRRRRSWRDRLFSAIRLVWMWWAQVSRRSRWRPRYRTFCVGGMGRLLRVIVGQFHGLKVKVQWADFNSFILIPQSLYQVWSRFKWNWMRFGGYFMFWDKRHNGFVIGKVTCDCMVSCWLVGGVLIE
jgi:hypothetical protein